MLRGAATAVVTVACCIGCCGSFVEAALVPQEIEATLVSETLQVGRPGTLTLTIHNVGDRPHTFGFLQFPGDIDSRVTFHGSEPAWTGRALHAFDDDGERTAFVFDEPVAPGQKVIIEMEVSVDAQVEPTGMVELCLDPEAVDTPDEYLANDRALCVIPWHTFDVAGAPERDIFAPAPPKKKKKKKKGRGGRSQP